MLTQIRRYIVAGPPWMPYIGFSALASLAYYLALPTPPWRAIIYTIIGLAALTVIGISLWRNRAHNRLAWIVLGVGLLLYFTGDVLFNYFRFFQHNPRPFPSIADAFFLLAHVPLAAGLLVLARRQQRQAGGFSLIDTGILASGLGLLWWVFLMAPQAYDPHFSLLERIIAVAYPAMDFLLLAAGIRLALTTRRPYPSHYMLAASVGGLLGADIIYSILQLNHIYTVGTAIDLGWIWFYCFMGAAVLYAAPVAAATEEPPSIRRLKLRLALLTLAALLLPATLLSSRLLHLDQPDPATIILGTILIAFVLIRMQKLMRENLSLQQELAQWKSDVLFRSIVQRAYSGVSVLGPDLSPIYYSPAMETMASLDRQTKLPDIVHPGDRGAFGEFWDNTLKGSGTPSLEYRLKGRDGSWRDVESVSNNLLADEWIHGVVIITRDIGVRKQHERELQKMAYTDALTGLPNRAALQLQLEHAISSAAGTGRLAAVLFFDLDNFSSINDSLGHSSGDQVLIQLASRLSTKLGPGSTIARFGGDEFLVITEKVRLPADAKLIYQRLIAEFDKPFEIGTYRVHLTACTGIALCDNPKATAEEVIRDADLALNLAKQAGPGSMRIFNEALYETSVRHLELATALSEALSGSLSRRQAPQLAYQPIVNLSSRRLAGAEALTIWHHERYGYIEQDELTTIATESDLLDRLESYQLEQLCQVLSSWAEYIDNTPFSIAINIAPASVSRPGFDTVILDRLFRRGIKPSRLVLEISEAAFIRHRPAAVMALANLIDNGVRITIDDFGREYSSLGQIHRLPKSDLKIDRSLVESLDEPDTLAILGSIVALAHALHRSVVAQGVDTEDQAAELAQIGCDYAQGICYGRPVPAPQFEHQLKSLAR